MGPWCQRNAAIERITAVGRRHWRKESGAHRQARAENGMYRYKHLIVDRLCAKHLEAQKREALIAVNVLNRMTGACAGNCCWLSCKRLLWKQLRTKLTQSGTADASTGPK